MADSNETILRLLQILHTTDEKSPLNAPQIMQIMEQKFRQRMGRDTVYNEIQTLQYCGYDIHQCENKRNGWYMGKHEFEDWQLKIMYDSIVQARCITASEETEIRKKLLSLTSSRGAKRILAPFEPVNRSVVDHPELSSYLNLMLEAIYTGHRVNFQYTTLDENMRRVLRKEGKVYELSIYSLYWSNDTYYVIGGHEKRKDSRELTNYRLDRMENLTIAEEDMIPVREFLGDNPSAKLQDYIDRQVNHYSGTSIRLVLEFDPTPQNMSILADFTGSDIILKHLKNGRVQARFIKMDSEALRGWLLKYVNRYVVVEPANLRKEIVDALKKGLEEYK